MRWLMIFIICSVFAWLFPRQVLADWQIVSRNILLTTGEQTKNLTIIDIEQDGARIDTGDTSCIILYKNPPEEILLFHTNKTYQYLPPLNIFSSLNVPLLQAALTTNIDGYSVSLYSYTNGPRHISFWTVPVSGFIKGDSDTNDLADLARPLFSEKYFPGAIFGTDAIVIGNQSMMLSQHVAQSSPNARVASASPGDILYSTTSKLVSITRTNFAASEFQVPDDYTLQNNVSSPAFGGSKNSFNGGGFGPFAWMHAGPGQGGPPPAFPRNVSGQAMFMYSATNAIPWRSAYWNAGTNGGAPVINSQSTNYPTLSFHATER
jgi:hypothetical protein